MNKTIQRLYLLLGLVALLATSCKQQEEPDVLSLDLPTSLITFTQAGGSLEVGVITTDNEWSIEQGPKSDWLKVEKVKDGVKLTAEENHTGKKLETKVTITLRGLRKEIKVTQSSTLKTLAVEKTSWDVGSEGGELIIPVIASGNDWSYTLSEESPWLTAEKSSDSKSLKVMVQPSVDPNPREVYIALSYGESATLRIRQVGVRLFPDFKLLPDMTRADVEAYAQEAGLQQDTELINVNVWDDDAMDFVKKQKTRKEASWTKDDFFVTDAQQAKYLVYQYDNNNQDKVFATHIIGVEGTEFSVEEVATYLSSKGFIKGGEDPRGGELWVKNDLAALLQYEAKVFYKYGQQMSPSYPKAARITISLPNKIDPDDIGAIMTEFPTDRLDTFRDPAIQFEQVEAFEKGRGFRLMTGEDDGYPFCKNSDVEGYTHLYEYVQFENVHRDNAKEGDLISTLYNFLIPGMDNYGKDYNVTATKENAGAIGQRIDMYKGYKKFFTRHDWTGAWNLKPEVVELAKKKGYELAHTDRGEYGWTYFTKGDDVIFIAPGEDSVQVAYFRNAETAEAARNHKRED